MDRQYLEHGFGPFYKEDSKLLILGSFPSVKSREEGFFYGHKQNRFWKLTARLFACETPQTIEEKRAFLEKNKIALYDVIESCSIIGSSDSSIKDVRPADIKSILEGSSVGSHIFTNGSKAYELYCKYILPELNIYAVKLPSTSPANAVFSLERLDFEWRKALKEFI